MKRLVVLLMALILTFAAFSGGCKFDKGGNESDTNIATGDIPENVTIANKGNDIYVGTKEGKKRIKISYADTGYGVRWLQVMAANFVAENDEYWIFLEGDPGLTDSVSTKLDTGLHLSDVYFLLASNSLNYSRSGWLEDLSDVFESKPDGETGSTVYDKMKDKWQYHCWEPYKSELKQYVYPWTESITGIAYNKGMFDKYGWEVPVTVSDLIALCNQIKKDTDNKISPFVYPGQVGGYFYVVNSWWLQSSGYDAVDKYYLFESPEVFNPDIHPQKGKLDALNAFTSLFGPDVDYSLEGSMSKNHIEAQIAFLRGEAAMIPSASWLETEMEEDMPDDFQLRLMPAPYLDNARKDADGNYEKFTYACSPDYAIIPSGASEKEGAKKFLSYMASDKMLQLFTKYTGTLRPFKYDIEPIYNELTEFTKSCVEITRDAQMWFETSRADMYTAGYTQSFLNTINPFPSLIYGPDNKGQTPEELCLTEYVYALENWDKWVKDINRNK